MGRFAGYQGAALLLFSFATGACAQKPAKQHEQAASPPAVTPTPVPTAQNEGSGESAPQAAQHQADKQARSSDAVNPQAPPGLQCLARAYDAKAIRHDQAWTLRMGTGKALPWTTGDDLAERSAQQRLDQSSLKDMMAQPYSTGPIVPVHVADWDPGRARNEEFFSLLYGGSSQEVKAQLKSTRLLASRLSVHQKILPAVERVNTRLQNLIESSPQIRPWLVDLGGSFNWRHIAGTNRKSAHSWGIAIDLNPSRSDYWRNHGTPPVWTNRVPEEIVHAFEAEGFIWGGRWNHFDTMHFEYRPELLDPECQAATPLRPSWELSQAADESLQARFPTPEGAKRDEVAKDSFAAFLRNLPLLPPGSEVKSYAGDTIVDSTDKRLSAVVDLDVGARDLQQCADSVIRLHAEWAFSANKAPIEYRAGNGARFGFQRYLAGERFRAQGAKLIPQTSAASQGKSHRALRKFLDSVFNWVNTGALAHYSQPVKIEDIRAGDFFVVGGSPYGHAVLVLDVARTEKGEPLLLLGQGYMPAQSFHVLRSATGSPWFELHARSDSIKTPFWAPFPFDSLRRFSRPS